MYNPTKPYKHQILKLIESTWNTPYLKVEKGLYPIFKKNVTSWEVSHTDGIGTKGIYHWRARTFDAAVLDALAMNLNDLAMVGGVPYAIQNHIVLPVDDHRAILAIVKKLVNECKKRNIAMTGGETSIHTDATGMDISITVSAFIPHRHTNRCAVGDVLIGLPSNGLHANGLTKVRELYGTRMQKEFTEPTRIYLDTILALLKKHKVHGMMHITGGAFTKLKDILTNADAIIAPPATLSPQKIFRDMYAKGVSNKTLYSTFNCGIGFVLSVPRRTAPSILHDVQQAAIIGQVVKGKGAVHISSAFDGRSIILT